MRLLCERKGNVTIQSYAEGDSGECVTHCALRYGNRRVLEVLVEYKAKLISCSSCKRGKPCSKVKPETLEWYKGELIRFKTYGKDKGKKPIEANNNVPPDNLSANNLSNGTSTEDTHPPLLRCASAPRLRKVNPPKLPIYSEPVPNTDRSHEPRPPLTPEQPRSCRERNGDEQASPRTVAKTKRFMIFFKKKVKEEST